ncbi:hypothetical protein BVI2075_450017 [Burkholderia vietnamiensis]|nr:hypothetical protein BVI2075_450017 [Burkholderia vietnamiensis]
MRASGPPAGMRRPHTRVADYSFVRSSLRRYRGGTGARQQSRRAGPSSAEKYHDFVVRRTIHAAGRYLPEGARARRRRGDLRVVHARCAHLLAVSGLDDAAAVLRKSRGGVRREPHHADRRLRQHDRRTSGHRLFRVRLGIERRLGGALRVRRRIRIRRRRTHRAHDDHLRHLPDPQHGRRQVRVTARRAPAVARRSKRMASPAGPVKRADALLDLPNDRLNYRPSPARCCRPLPWHTSSSRHRFNGMSTCPSATSTRARCATRWKRPSPRSRGCAATSSTTRVR